MILQSPTGVGMFLICTVITAGILIFRSKILALKIAMVLLIICIPSISLYQFHSAYNELLVDVPVDKNDLEEFTVYGNKYVHYVDNSETENGNRTWIYICWDELEEVWTKRSSIDFSGEDQSGNLVKYTAVRYLTSKGLRKDAEGLSSIADSEIKKIEKGIANANREGLGNFSYRIYQLVWEYRNYVNGGNPSGHSMPMRIEYWKAASGIIAGSPIIGVGTGDLPQAFSTYYEEHNSLLGEKWRRRAHNQYLSIMAAFGIVGFLCFLFALFYPGIKLGRFHDYYYLIFFIVMAISMLTEDTIESQVGVSIFAFFNSLLLFRETSESEA
ncbi:MAG: O-antigen ligase family protein [Bacteroidia bacterium]|nr:O-antigen ligase family protein [Bacteroidia bacterium]